MSKNTPMCIGMLSSGCHTPPMDGGILFLQVTYFFPRGPQVVGDTCPVSLWILFYLWKCSFWMVKILEQISGLVIGVELLFLWLNWFVHCISAVRQVAIHPGLWFKMNGLTSNLEIEYHLYDVRQLSFGFWLQRQQYQKHLLWWHKPGFFFFFLTLCECV